MPTQKKFYHRGTERKLRAIESYLKSYLKVFKNQGNIETIYIDAFAGSGTMPTNETADLLEDVIDADEFVCGSALRAVNLEDRFSRYIFIDEDAKKLNELEQRLGLDEVSRNRAEFVSGDANAELINLCPHISKPNVRAVVFLDPFGSQVGWHTLDALAQTRHVDLWYLFPSFLGVYRQIGNQGAKMDAGKARSLDRMFGHNDWRSAFIGKSVVNDLFGPREIEQKKADIEDITRFKIKCMKEIFKGAVLDEWMPLGRGRAHWYSLIFAMANPSPRAVSAGRGIAASIMRKR